MQPVRHNYGLETHLTTSIKLINKFNPNVVILDPINAFVIRRESNRSQNNVTAPCGFFEDEADHCILHKSHFRRGIVWRLTDVYISSLIDTWLLLRDIEIGGERNRGLYVLKSRGMAHSNQIREFRLTNHGIELLDVYVGAEGVLTGSARLSQETKDDAEQLLRQQEMVRKQFGLERKREAMEAQVRLLRSEFEAEESEALKVIGIEKARNERFTQDKIKMAKSRRRDVDTRQIGTGTNKAVA